MKESWRIPYKKLMKERRSVRDTLLERLGFSKEELETIRSKPIDEAIISAAESLYAKIGDSRSVSFPYLAAVATKEQSMNNATFLCSAVVAGLFEQKRKQLEYTSKLKLSNIHMLRRYVGAYSGNLEGARRWSWKNFQPSAQDFQRSLRIPYRLRYEESQLLGIYWGDGVVTDYRRGMPHIVLSGKTTDFPFYELFIKPRGERIHNIRLDVKRPKFNFEIAGKAYTFEHPVIDINSKALSTWLTDDLGFPEGEKRKLELPNAEFDRTGFFEGIVATLGYKKRRRPSFKPEYAISDKDEYFVRVVKRLAEELGYKPTGPYPSSGGSYHINRINRQYTDKTTHGCAITFNSSETKKLKILNPAYLE